MEHALNVRCVWFHSRSNSIGMALFRFYSLRSNAFHRILFQKWKEKKRFRVSTLTRSETMRKYSKSPLFKPTLISKFLRTFQFIISNIVLSHTIGTSCLGTIQKDFVRKRKMWTTKFPFISQEQLKVNDTLNFTQYKLRMYKHNINRKILHRLDICVF